MINNELNNKKSYTKAPLYVTVYEKLYDKIMNGNLDSGKRLPSEYALAKEMGVSRGTLRQALLLLQEDGIIFNRQGIGNFIATNNLNRNHGLEKKSIIPLEFCKKECDVSLTNVTYQPSTKIIQDNFQMDHTKLVALFELIFTLDEEVIANMDVFIPYEALDEKKISLNNKEVMLEFILNYIDAKTNRSRITTRMVEAREHIAQRLEVRENTPIICFYEICYSKLDNPLIYSKTYCIPEYFEFNINSKK